MKKIIILTFTTILFSACGASPSTNQNLELKTTSTPSDIPTITTDKNTKSSIVGLNTKDGQIVIKLYDKETPSTVATFMKKVNSGFYNNLLFHRVIPGFMAQGGDPTGTGTGGGRQKSELNTIPFKKGSLGLARTAETNQVSNDSQFFICFNDTGCAHLTGDYVNFGEVISGFDVLDKITQGDKILSITANTK